MKKIFAILIIALTCAGAASAQKKQNDWLEFEETRHDFGTVDGSVPVVHEYRLVNTYTEPVAVLSVSTECGCARPEYPVKPLAPGDTAYIKVTYTPQGETGEVIKDFKVRYRAAKASKSKRKTLRLTGTVLPK